MGETGTPLFTLGAGSNLLVSDSGFEGVVVKMGRLNLDIRLESPDRLQTGASVAVSSLLRRAAQDGIAGLEFLTGVPGSVGGTVVMNAGTHLGEVKDAVEAVEGWDWARGEVVQFGSECLRFEYRKNLFLPPNTAITRVTWRVRPEDSAVVKALIDTTLTRRKSTQPLDYPSCGSVFKNPKAHGLHAWQVIDRLGLRGHRIGNAQISEKHSNFILNLGKASAEDVRALISLVQARAHHELGIAMEPEVMVLG